MRLPRKLTRAERMRKVENAIVRDILAELAGRDVATLAENERSAFFDRALEAVRTTEDEDERERLLILVMDAIGFGRE